MKATPAKQYDYSTESVVTGATAAVTMIAVDAGDLAKDNMLNYRTESMITDKKQSKFKQLLSFSALGNDSPTSSDAEEEYAR